MTDNKHKTEASKQTKVNKSYNVKLKIDNNKKKKPKDLQVNLVASSKNNARFIL